MQILWACFVHEKDTKWLPNYLSSISNSTILPNKVVVIDSDNSGLIRTMVEQSGLEFVRYIPYALNGRNRGFNPSFNLAVRLSIEEDYNWLATMTVRALPSSTWLEKSLSSGNSSTSVGMVTTLHIDKNEKIYNFGHFLSPSGAGFDFGRDVPFSSLDSSTIDYLKPEAQVIWSPCSGGALYRVKALRKAAELLQLDNYDLFHPNGFKSYNCPVLGFLIRAAGFHNICSPEAICFRDGSESTSRYPNSPGLLINQEVNRIANIYSFWPADLIDDALNLYFTERRNSKLQIIDKRISAVLAENLIRNWNRGNKVDSNFRDHIKNFVLIKEWMRNEKI